MTLYVHAAGAVTSVGLDLASSAAAIRAGLDSFEETDFSDSQNEPIVGARIHRPEEDSYSGMIVGGPELLARWLCKSISQCLYLYSMNKNKLAQDQALLIIILMPPERRRSIIDAEQLKQSCMENCFQDAQKGALNIQCIQCDAPGLVDAFNIADTWFAEHGNGAVIIAAVDSWLNNPSLLYAMEKKRVLTSDKSEGFIPGEAAAAILLRNSSMGCEHPILKVSSAALAQEQAHLCQDEKPCFGVGLAKATSEALVNADIFAHEIDQRLRDISGEEYFFDEDAYAWARLLRQPLPYSYRQQQPATKIGDIGTTIGPFLVAYAFQLNSIYKNFRPPAKHTLIQLSSEYHTRAAVVLTRNER